VFEVKLEEVFDWWLDVIDTVYCSVVFEELNLERIDVVGEHPSTAKCQLDWIAASPTKAVQHALTACHSGSNMLGYCLRSHTEPWLVIQLDALVKLLK
jgi:hypothetical protein